MDKPRSSICCFNVVPTSTRETIVEELLKRGANPNVTVDDTTPLHSSVWAEHGNAQNAQIAKLLLDYGADPNPKCYENRSPL